MPSPSPGANTPSSSGNGTPKLLNDYVRFHSPFLSDFAHGGCLSNSAIVSGKARLVKSIVRSPNFSPPPAVPSLVLRCPQLGHGGDRGRKGDHVSQYTEGRDIPNHGGRSAPSSRPPLTHTTLPQSEIDLLKNLNVRVSIPSPLHLLTQVQHPNIVKYKGFFKTREFLYIILECVTFCVPKRFP